MLGRLYYFFKPCMPWRIRMALRRMAGRRKRRTHANVWPIDPLAGQKPANWRGWPDGKKFAFVLTHDVEAPTGLAKCLALAELELELGFRSSFNFIPEGSYVVPPQIREWLKGHGFEVGVHDLHHNGKLFASRRGFQRMAAKINHHLRNWDAVGFRSGFMLRNLDWIHDLAIQYDASTFDTDPFELQSDGTRTIFPFWIPTPVNSTDASGAVREPQLGRPGGYVELPYTLPQDSTLFLVLREQTPDIWLRKLDWIANHGGMALVNVHPDYIAFSGSPGAREYAAEKYAALLRYVAAKYRDQYWSPLPKDLANWFRESRTVPSQTEGKIGTQPACSAPPAALRRKRAAVLLYSSYPADPRPRRATEALAESGMEIDLFCISESVKDPLHESINGVQVYRLPMQHRRDSKRAYLWQYGRFLWSSFWFLTKHSMRQKYDLVHVHNMPDVLVFSALVAKLRGAKVILDLHDPMPELMMTIFGTRERSLGIRMLKLLEKCSIGFADQVLTVNEACKKLFSARSGSGRKISVVMNAPDENIFRFNEAAYEVGAQRHDPQRRFVVMYHGSLVERHGLDLAVAALAKIRPSIPGAELWVFGNETPFLQKVMRSTEGSDLRHAVRYFGPKKLEQIVEAIRSSDVGIIPNRRSIFTEINTPTRIFEYLSQGKPVIAPRAAGILDYFGPSDLFYFELGDADDLASQLELVFREPDAARETVRRGQEVYRRHDWRNERQRFLQGVFNLLGVQPASAVEPANDFVASTGGTQ